MEFIKAGGSYAIVLEKITNFASRTLGIAIVPVFAPSKKFLLKDKD
jgi:aconitate hydratase 2/2-methylisocitrate dehydratase